MKLMQRVGWAIVAHALYTERQPETAKRCTRFTGMGVAHRQEV